MVCNPYIWIIILYLIMATILDVHDNWKRILKLPDQIPVFVYQTRFEIVRYNTEEQLAKGIRSDGQNIAPSYRDREYAEGKFEANSLPGFGTPDLKLTGSFYKGFYVAVDTEIYEIDSRDSKTDKLLKKYGENIFGLTQPNKEQYATKSIYPKIKDYIESRTGLVMQ